MPLFAHHDEEEEFEGCRLIPSLIREACAHCHVSSCLGSPSSLSSDDEGEETLPDSHTDNKHVIILEIRSRAMKAKPKPKDCLFTDSLHCVLSPTTGKLLIAPKDDKVDNNDESEVFYSVNSGFSRCSSEKELDYFSHFRGRSIWEEFMDCEGWPFGLCRKALMLPPLPSSPSDSWIWRKRNLNSKVCTSI